MLNSIRHAVKVYQNTNFETTGLIGARILSGCSVGYIAKSAVRDFISYSKQKPKGNKMVGTHTVIAAVNRAAKNKTFTSKREHFGWYLVEANMQYRKLSK